MTDQIADIESRRLNQPVCGCGCEYSKKFENDEDIVWLIKELKKARLQVTNTQIAYARGATGYQADIDHLIYALNEVKRQLFEEDVEDIEGYIDDIVAMYVKEDE